MILRQAVLAGRWWTAALFLVFLAVVFAGLARIFMDMIYGGKTPPQEEKPFREPRAMLWPAGIFFLLVLMLGLHVPAWLDGLIRSAALLAGGAQ